MVTAAILWNIVTAPQGHPIASLGKSYQRLPASTVLALKLRDNSEDQTAHSLVFGES